MLGHGRMYGDTQQGDGTLTGAHEVGANGFSGMVPAGSAAPVLTNPDEGGRRDELGGGRVLTHPQSGYDFAPIAGTETRPMLGGLRAAPFTRLLVDAPAYDGGHTIMAHRTSVTIYPPSEQMVPEQAGELPSLRVPPISDPLGQSCANARAAAGQ